MRALTLAPDTSIDFAYRELGLQIGQVLDEAEARKVGEVVEARRVAWGSYKFDGQKWSLSFRILNTATGKTTRSLSASSSDWSDVLCTSAKNILRGLGTSPGGQKSMRFTPTTSAQALELMSRAYGKLRDGSPLPDVVTDLRRALMLDPDFAMALRALSYTLMLEGSEEEALETAKRGVQTHPEYAAAHASLGTVYLFQGLKSLATEEFSEAVRLEPNVSEYYRRLAEIYIQEAKWAEATDTLQQALKWEPYDPVAHAMLGNAFARQAKTGLARTQLKLAQRYDFNADPGVKQWSARGYEFINDIVKAITNYQAFLEAAKARAVTVPSIEEAETALARLRARLVPHPLPITPVRDFPPAELEATLRSKLTDEEYHSVIIPFAATPKIREWAQQVAAGAQDEFEKGERLFYAISGGLTPDQESDGGTTGNVFDAGTTAPPYLTCQDYTFRYMAAARQLGLRVYFAAIRKDYLGHQVSHACAALFTNGEVLLVDPSYRWFGVPHQEFELLDDSRVVGYYMCELQDPAKVKIGLRLVPDWAEPRFDIAVSFLNKGNFQQAREFFDMALKLDSTSWRAHYANSIMEAEDRNWDAAKTNLLTCLNLYPDFQGAHYALAGVLLAKGELPAARDEYRTYLEGDTEPQSAANARSAIARINEELDRRKEVGP